MLGDTLKVVTNIKICPIQYNRKKMLKNIFKVRFEFQTKITCLFSKMKVECSKQLDR